MRRKRITVYRDGTWEIRQSAADFSPLSVPVATIPLGVAMDEAEPHPVKRFINRHAALITAISTALALLVGWAAGEYGLLELLQRMFQ